MTFKYIVNLLIELFVEISFMTKTSTVKPIYVSVVYEF